MEVSKQNFDENQKLKARIQEVAPEVVKILLNFRKKKSMIIMLKHMKPMKTICKNTKPFYPICIKSELSIKPKNFEKCKKKKNSKNSKDSSKLK